MNDLTDLNDQLAEASMCGDIALCRELIDRGANARDVDSSALAMAAEMGLIDICRLLIENGARAGDRDSWALARAAGGGHNEICRLLIENGARACDDRSRALAWAAWGGRADICRLLLQSGASFAEATQQPSAGEVDDMLFALPPDAIDIARAIYPQKDDEWIAAKAESNNPLLAESLHADAARSRASARLKHRLSGG